MKKFKKFLKNVLSTMFNQLKFLKMKKVTLLVIAVLFSLSLSACMKFELPKTTEQGSNKEINNGKTDKTEDQPAKPDPEEEQYGTGVLLTPQEDYVKIPLASLPVRGEKHLPSSFKLPFPDWAPQQGQIGSCLGHALSSIIMYSVNFKLRKIDCENRDMYPSPSFIYNLGKAPGGCDAGMYVKEGMRIVIEEGVPPIKIMPYKYECKVKPSADAYRLASKTKIRGYERLPVDITKIKEAIYSELPVLAVVDIGKKFRSAFTNHTIWRPEGEKFTQAYHAIVLMGYHSSTLENYFIAYNSWGNNKGGSDGEGTLRISEKMIQAGFIKECYILDPFDTYQSLTDDNEDQEDDTPKPEPQTIQVDQSELKFETTAIGQKTAKVLQITMTSGEDTQLSLKLSDPSNFEVKDMKEVNLYKNAKRSIEIFYTPKTPAASHTASLTLTTPELFNYKVRLYGEVKQPEPEHDDIVIDNQSIDFGSIQLQQGTSVTTKQKSFRVTNNNQADVTLTLSSNTDAYTVSPEKVTISPRNTQTITVRLNVRGEGYYPGSIRVQSTRGYEERVQLSAQVVEQQRNDDRGDDRDRDNDRGDNHQDQNDQDHRQQPRYRVEVVPVSNVKKGDCIGLNKETLSGKITGKDSTVEETANGELILNIKLKKVDGGRYLRNGKFFIKYESFCNLAIDRKGVAYEAGIYQITTSLRMSSDIVGRVIYLQTNADKPDGSEGERNYCAIKVVRN